MKYTPQEVIQFIQEEDVKLSLIHISEPTRH